MKIINRTKLLYGTSLVVLASGLAAAMLYRTPTVSAQSDAREMKRSQSFSLVELFTSEGCSSCPSADENLAKITETADGKKLPIYTLSFHVDYWNYIGWTDPFSSQDATKRQRQYSGVHGTSQVYTPQMIVNGTKEFVGSNAAKSSAAIKSALQHKVSTSITAQAMQSKNLIEVNLNAKGAHDGDVLLVALVQNHAERKVTAGENSGHSLQHVNVVRDFKVQEKSSGMVSLLVPSDFDSARYHVIAFVQNATNGEIHAATRTEIDPS